MDFVLPVTGHRTEAQLPPGLLHRVKEVGHLHLGPVPVPGAHGGLQLRVVGLVVANAVLPGVHPGDQGGVGGIGEGRVDRAHMGAAAGMGQEFPEEGLLPHQGQVLIKKRVQGYQNHFHGWQTPFRIKRRVCRGRSRSGADTGGFSGHGKPRIGYYTPGG